MNVSPGAGGLPDHQNVAWLPSMASFGSNEPLLPIVVLTVEPDRKSSTGGAEKNGLPVLSNAHAYTEHGQRDNVNVSRERSHATDLRRNASQWRHDTVRHQLFVTATLPYV